MNKAMIENDRNDFQKLLQQQNIYWKEHQELQQALKKYTMAHGLELSGDESYGSGIDCVFVYIDKKPVFIIGLPPVSNYPVDETEYTNKYLRPVEAVAV
jgi:hypothetical protein